VEIEEYRSKAKWRAHEDQNKLAYFVSQGLSIGPDAEVSGPPASREL